MREIKFRAWDKDNKEMDYYPSIIFNQTNTDINKDKLDKLEFEATLDMNSVFEKIKELNHLILMQYTGLLDKNGKEIYEGDILKGSHYRNEINEHVYCEDYIVKYNNEIASFILESSIISGDVYFSNGTNTTESEALEIIGNIYSNPELLK